MANKIRLAVLLSGGGRTLENLVDQIANHDLPAQIGVVISSDASAMGNQRARNHDLPVEVIERKNYATTEAFSDAIIEVVDRYGVDLVVLAGFLHLVQIPDRYANKVMNIHPSLLPKYGGKGFYTDRVHRAVLEAGDTITGCTVHFANNEYDRGPIILQRQVPVIPADTAKTLAQKVFLEECRAYPEAIRLYAKGKLSVEDGKVLIDGKPALGDG